MFWLNRLNLPSLPAHGGHEGAAGVSVPGAVGVSGQAALSAGLTIQLTLIQAQLRHTLPGAHKQPLLEMEERRGGMKNRNNDGMEAERERGRRKVINEGRPHEKATSVCSR